MLFKPPATTIIFKLVSLSVTIPVLITLVYLIAEQAVISEQGEFFQEIVKQAGHNKQAGWSVLKKTISEQAEFYTKSPY